MELIVAFDASSESNNALESAIDLAKQTGAQVTALYAVQQNVSETETDCGYPIIEGLSEAETRGARVLAAAEATAEAHECDIQTDVAYGDPVQSVVDYANDRDGSSIFVGHRGVAAQRAVISSVAQGLIRESPVPVTVVN